MVLMSTTYHLSSILGPSTPITRHPALAALRDLPRLGRGRSFDRAVVDDEGHAIALTSSNEGPATRGEISEAALRRMAVGREQDARLQDVLWLLDGRLDRVDLALLRLRQSEWRETLAHRTAGEGLCESRLADWLRALPGSGTRAEAFRALGHMLGGRERARELVAAAVLALPDMLPGAED